jgi:hypothetical protein
MESVWMLPNASQLYNCLKPQPPFSSVLPVERRYDLFDEDARSGSCGRFIYSVEATEKKRKQSVAHVQKQTEKNRKTGKAGKSRKQSESRTMATPHR